MPRKPKSQMPTDAVVPTTALMASAHRFTGKVPRVFTPSNEWQARAYHHYSHCGEARFAARYFGQAMSRATLYVANQKNEPKTSGASVKVLDQLFAGPEGQSGMLELVGVHLTVAGECYLVGRTVKGIDVWEVVSVMEIDGGAGGWWMKAPDSEARIKLDDDDVIIRVWVPRPDKRWEADSPFRSLLPVLDEIEWLSRYIHSQATSRLTGNGLLVVPKGLTFPPPPPVEGKEQEALNEADAFMVYLGNLMTEALKGDGSAAEQVPGVVAVEGEHIEKLTHLKFWTELDAQAREMRSDAIHRFALGMDLPPEMVLGMGSNEGTGGGRSNGVSHWGAWMLEEQTIKLHIEPKLESLCAALTGYYLRPLVGGSTDKVLADTSRLRLRPDRSEESMELYDRGVLKAAVMLKENGFDPEKDFPDDAEHKNWMLRKIATTTSIAPEQVAAALALLGIDLGPVEPPAGPPPEKPAQLPPPPSLEDHPTRPRTPAESSILLYESFVLRALERAGNRLRNMAQTSTPGRAFEAHTVLEANGTASKCLEDAWSTAEAVLGDDEEAKRVIKALDGYCRVLMANKEPHTREALAAWAEKAGI